MRTRRDWTDPLVTDMLIAMLGICSQEELDEEEIEEVEVLPEEVALSGPSFSLRLRRLIPCRGGDCRASQGHQEQDSRGRQDVANLLRSAVRPATPVGLC